ncbi:MAG: ribbon-helix-helix domain-containing protein [Lachnospiraceae bacterium]|nr:ribbon-helix-helix domain-containing protein [Butyrivibrio sp.]MCM1344600.1 ribbon-helix-helix domain-containing protein [Muribaculaceae bacterium]MCM1410641.1 ribbon-helix-helix domain-containing protein [Lachnospiraceae bacterium]
MEKFVVIPKEDKGVTMTIRIDRSLQEQYNQLATKTNRSRNELICMALQYALDNMIIQENSGNKVAQ